MNPEAGEGIPCGRERPLLEKMSRTFYPDDDVRADVQQVFSLCFYSSNAGTLIEYNLARYTSHFEGRKNALPMFWMSNLRVWTT